MEPATVLQEKIYREKALMISSKQIPKEKSFPKISSDKVRYKLPNSWHWCNLGEIVVLYSGRDLNPSEYSETKLGYPYLTGASQIKDGKILLNRWTNEPKVLSILGDVLISVKGTIGKTVINEVGEIHIARQIMALRQYSWTENNYLKLFCESYVATLQNVSNGIIPGISREHLLYAEFPLPPLAEQKAIVEVVNQLFAEVEQLETLTKERIQFKEDLVTSALNQLTQASEAEVASHWDFLKSQFSTFFTEKENIKKLREAILQLAVQGKLTHHWRTDVRLSGVEVEHASTLLEKIKAEKEQLIKEKKIKKEKPLPPISEDEVPYELPEGWVWCRMGSVSDIQRGSSPRPKGDPLYFSETETSNNWISIKDISKHSLNYRLQKTDEFLTDLGVNYSRFVNVNELIVAVSGSTTGKCCLTGIEGYIYDGLAVVRLINSSIDPEYHLMYYLQLYSHMNDSKFGAAFPNINTKFLNEMLFPFPPQKEQKAIIEKVNGLMSLCDQLEKETENHQTTQEQWMHSCLREVV